jgi:cyanobactin cluster PatC/TenC/TruC protein
MDIPGLEDFAYDSELFKDRTGEGHPPYRRGRIWS